MNNFSKTIACTVFTLGLFIFSAPVVAKYDQYGNATSDEESDNAPEITRRIRTGKYNLTPQVIKSSALRALLNYNWEIIDVSKNQINAENRTSLLTVKFKEASSLAVTLKSKSGGSSSPKWLNSINKYLTREFTFHYFNQKFDQ